MLQHRVVHRPTNVPTANRFIFLSNRNGVLRYESLVDSVYFSHVIASSQRGYLCHQWLEDIIYANTEGSILLFVEDTMLELSLSLAPIYHSDLVLHAFNQQDGTYQKWNTRDRLRKSRTKPFVRYMYQAASSPY